VYWFRGQHGDDGRVPRVTVLRGPRDGPQTQVGPLRPAANSPGVIDVPHRPERGGVGRGGRVVVHIPTGVARGSGGSAGDLVRAAWRPGVAVVIADMTTVGNWDDAGLASLQTAHTDLVRKQAELRLVVWSAGLYAALQTAGISGRLPVYANVDAALRDP
jgi:hypothetical protein